MSILKADSINLEFDNLKILQDIWLECKQGEVVGILGRNGCGKSSLLRIIFGSLKPQYKHVSIDGEFISKGYHNNRIAYLPQHNYLPSNAKISSLARMLVDERFWDKFSEHEIYRECHNRRTGNLSGGQQRQLETLLVIYSKADFILLDEPFTHISPIQSAGFKEIIRDIAAIKGVILTDHQYYNILDVSNRIILITNGATKHIKSNADLVTYNYLSQSAFDSI